jgi:hypothetical protein
VLTVNVRINSDIDYGIKVKFAEEIAEVALSTITPPPVGIGVTYTELMSADMYRAALSSEGTLIVARIQTDASDEEIEMLLTGISKAWSVITGGTKPAIELAVEANAEKFDSHGEQSRFEVWYS